VAVMLEFQVEGVDAEYARLQRLDAVSLDYIVPLVTLPCGNRSI
jgi:hypothetical protein